MRARSKQRTRFSIWLSCSYACNRCASAAAATVARSSAVSGISPLSTITTRLEGVPLPVPTASMAFTTFMPSITRPKTTCLPSNHGVSSAGRRRRQREGGDRERGGTHWW